MGCVLRVRFAAFFAGAAVASAGGLYFLHKDYKVAHQSMSQQGELVDSFKELEKIRELVMKDVYKSLDGRISSLENLKEIEAMKPVEGAE